INIVPDRGAHLRNARPRQHKSPNLEDAARHLITYMTAPSRQAAAPPSEYVMFMNQRQLSNHVQRNQQSGPSSGPVPPQPPIYPPAITSAYCSCYSNKFIIRAPYDPL
ncbi:MAG: hypothetical protein ACKPKO_19555, partial [Candidatus Fonsibacter sp.]